MSNADTAFPSFLALVLGISLPTMLVSNLLHKLYSKLIFGAGGVVVVSLMSSHHSHLPFQ